MRTPNGMPLADRIRAKSIQVGDCWIWSATKDSKGYGRIDVAGVNRRAHRVSYSAFIGPIPDGLEIDHLCRRPSCVNPEHLEAVTGDENNRRRVLPVASACKQGHAFDERNTLTLTDGRRQCRTCNRARAHAYRQRQCVSFVGPLT